MNWRPVGKILVIISSLTLGCTYVAYRQKQSEAPEPAGKEKTVMPSSKNPNRVTVFPSSKNIDAVILPGSPDSPRTNGDFINSTSLPEAPAEGAKKAEEKKRAVLPSSKIGAILSPDDAPVNRNNIDAILDEQRKKQEDEEKK